MKKNIILTYLLIGFTTLLFSQNNKTKSLEIGLGDGTPCTNMGFGCKTNKATAQMRFDKNNNELILNFSKMSLDKNSKDILLQNKLETDFYLYAFDKDFTLPSDIIIALGINKLTKIKHGNYLIKIIDDQIIIKLKLE